MGAIVDGLLSQEWIGGLSPASARDSRGHPRRPIDHINARPPHGALSRFRVQGAARQKHADPVIAPLKGAIKLRSRTVRVGASTRSIKGKVKKKILPIAGIFLAFQPR
jgi:hypothetical protein